MATDIEYSIMSGRAYQSTRNEKNWFPIPNGWTEKKHEWTDSSGFEAVSFQHGNEIVISFAGTNSSDINDLLTDLDLGLSGKSCDQLRQAALYYCQIRAANPFATITFTGHSLGGGLAAAMAVFFDEKAVTFDQAPFARAVRLDQNGGGVREDLIRYLIEHGMSEEMWILQPLINYGQELNNDFPSRAADNVTYQCVAGEFLSCPPFTAVDRIGVAKEILTHGTPDAGAFNLHSMALLTAFLENNDFQEVTKELPNLLRMIFDDKLYSFDTNKPSNDENFMERLIRYEFGTAPGATDTNMLTRFTHDMQKLIDAGAASAPEPDLTKTLIAFAMQAYYDDRLGTDRELFTTDGITGGVRFSRNDVADSLEDAKGYVKYFSSYLLSLPSDDRILIEQQLPDLLDWYIQVGSEAMTATASDKSAFMLGGKGANNLTGGDKNDLLVGGEGNDTLNVTDGKDYLLGGGGHDIFLVTGEVNGASNFYGGEGDDVIQGSAEDDTIDLSSAKVFDIETVDMGAGDDKVKAARSNEGPGIYRGGADDDKIDAKNAGRALKLYGDGGKDTLIGGKFGDLLIGGEDSATDRLEGGDGYDSYYARNTDTIKDTDGKGRVLFEDDKKPLSGGRKKKSETVYKGDGGEYTLDSGTLTFAKDGKTLTIENYSKENKDLGIVLTETDEPQLKQDQHSDFDSTGSPLILDLNGNGITSTFIDAHDIHFDLDSNGMAEKTGWVEEGDGLLALDRNSNGKIDNGGELFGNFTPRQGGGLYQNGFEALVAFDDNKDKIIDGKDQIFTKLTVWKDANQDGFSQKGELSTLAANHITAINMAYTDQDLLEERNRIKQSSVFTRQLIDSDGNPVKDAGGNILTEERIINDVWFDRDMDDTVLPDAPAIDPALLALGNMQGSGNVVDLGVAMSRDGQLAEMVQAFAAGADKISRLDFNTAADNILLQWSGTKEAAGINGYLLTSWGEYSVSNTTVAIVNAFAGSPFSMDLMGKTIDYASGMPAISSLHERYDNIRAELIMSLLGTKMFGQSVCDSTTGYIDHTKLENGIGAYLHGPSVTAAGKATMEILAAMLIKTSWLAYDEAVLANMGFADPTVILSKLPNAEYHGQPDGVVNYVNSTIHSYNYCANDKLYGSGGNDKLFSTQGYDILYGNDGDDFLDGGAGDDILLGGDGNDTMNGGWGWGNDNIRGGRGDDAIDGWGGSNTYYYAYGDGNDTISPSKTSITYYPLHRDEDRLILERIVESDVQFGQQGHDLLLSIKDITAPGAVSGTLLIKDWFVNPSLSIIEFASGERYITEDILEKLRETYGDSLDLSKFKGSVSLTGSDSADALSGGFFADNLSGGKGDDLLRGKGGDDRYLYKRGDGRDTVADNYLLDGGSYIDIECDAGVDTLVFGEGISSDDLIFQVGHGSTLAIGLKEEGKAFAGLSDTITIEQGLRELNRIEKIEFADGSTVQIKDLYSSTASVGDDILTGGFGGDVLFGGAGRDSLFGMGGDDTYVFGRGDGWDTVSDYAEAVSYSYIGYFQGYGGQADTLQFGPGIDLEDLLVGTGGDNLIIGLKEDDKAMGELSDVVTLFGQLDPRSAIEYFQFTGSGPKYRMSDLLPERSVGTDGGDTLFGHFNDDTLEGLGGDDTLFGREGDDTLIGGGEDDLLHGDDGDDTYVFNRGDGRDTILDSDPTLTGSSDILRFGAGITAADLLFQQQGKDLVIGLAEDGKTFAELVDRIVVTDWLNSANTLDGIRFADDTLLSIADMVQRIYGDSRIYGFDNDDTLTTTPGDNSFFGQEGHNTYIFNRGGGHDVVNTAGIQDRVIFGAGIERGDLCCWATGDDITIGLKEAGKLFAELADTLTIKNWYSPGLRLEGIDLADNTTISPDDILQMLATPDDDRIIGLETDDHLVGLAGGDSLHGQEGADFLDGGSGRDFVDGGSGDDTYFFGRGSGIDTITDSEGSDTINFGPGITRTEVHCVWEQATDNLLVYLLDPANPETPIDTLPDRLQVLGWYQDASRIERFVFADGTVLDRDGIVGAMPSEGNDALRGVVTDTVLNGLGGDVLAGGTGSDLLAGQMGDDTYLFNRGDGIDTIVDRGSHDWNDDNAVNAGFDAIVFGDTITSDHIIARWEEGSNNLVIGIIDPNQPDQSFAELTDKITIRDWYAAGSRIEELRFGDGTVVDVEGILNRMGTDSDTIIGQAGADFLNVGLGDDCCFFGRGRNCEVEISGIF